MNKSDLNRRSMLLGMTSAIYTTPFLATETAALTTDAADTPRQKRNVSSFRRRDWRDYFSKLKSGCILCDLSGRAVHFWAPNGIYNVYPSSVPMSDELTRRGYTQIVRKKVGPSWTPTKEMRERDPSLPTFMPAGEDNPLGSHAMYLTWPAYLIHGTHDTRKIGRQSSSGCVGLYNAHIEELFERTKIGTQVLLL
ncbi:MAG: L,D-transpeptidase [Aestuariivita sp.]|nr:L,D-transpeptidase [Aestuariivita sp.]